MSYTFELLHNVISNAINQSVFLCNTEATHNFDIKPIIVFFSYYLPNTLSFPTITLLVQ